MKITRVKFSNGDTSGFLLGTEYVRYPAVVQAYKQTGDVDSCVRLIANLLSRFTDESSHYFVDDKRHLSRASY